MTFPVKAAILENSLKSGLFCLTANMNIIQNLIVLGIILNIAGVPLAIAEPSPYETVILSYVTAYAAHPSLTDNDPQTAASGKKVYDGMIAANFLPFGTKVMFPEIFPDKEFTVDDRMHRRYNDVLIADILMDSIQSAKKFGVKRNVKMVILNQPKKASSTSQNQPVQKTPKISES